MIIEPAKRTLSVKEYYFSIKNKEIARLSAERVAKGEDPVINLGIGSPDGSPSPEAIEALAQCAHRTGVHGYQSYVGIPELRHAIAAWYERWYGVQLDPASEIQPLMGSKEGILLLSLTFLNKGDKVLVPNPGYPTYTSATLMCEAEVVKYDLLEENGWYPDFDQLESMDLSGVKLMWANYPNMPTGAPARRDVFEKLVAFARKHGILLINDNPYGFVLNEPQSILTVPGAREVCMEMNSLSKSHNMAGWRVGMLVGDAAVIKEVLKVKSQMDSGMFRGIQEAAVVALNSGDEWYKALNKEYAARREVACKIMDVLGCQYDNNAGGLYVWGRVPSGEAVDWSDKFLYEAGVFLTPGFIFGSNGAKYLRISLCANVPTLTKALEKISVVCK